MERAEKMIFVLDKPSGMTSHNAVSRMKRALGQKIKIGHTGTLDPMCTGVLPILTGNDTKLSDLLDGDKEYVASMKLGVLTDTQDITGTVLEERAADGICEADVRAALASFCGDREQLPPMYSSVKVGGKKLYELAREGKTVERKTRRITVYETEFLGQIAEFEYSFRISCSKGTYIRTIINDVGEALGCGACMTSLRRTKANGFDISDAVPLETAESYAREGRILSICRESEECFEHLGYCTVPDNGKKFYLNGGTVGVNRLPRISGNTPMMRAYSEDDTFLGLCRIENGGVKAVWSRI